LGFSLSSKEEVTKREILPSFSETDLFLENQTTIRIKPRREAPQTTIRMRVIESKINLSLP
jgi:hypothetical protein